MRTRRSSGPRASVSRPGRVQRARLRERNETRDPEATRRGVSISVNCAVKLLGPGSRFARPGHKRVKSRRAKRTVGHHSRFTMSNSAELFVPAALLRPGFVLVIASIPLEGWAERRSAARISPRRLRSPQAPLKSQILRLVPASRRLYYPHITPIRTGIELRVGHARLEQAIRVIRAKRSW